MSNRTAFLLGLVLGLGPANAVVTLVLVEQARSLIAPWLTLIVFVIYLLSEIKDARDSKLTVK